MKKSESRRSRSGSGEGSGNGSSGRKGTRCGFRGCGRGKRGLGKQMRFLARTLGGELCGSWRGSGARGRVPEPLWKTPCQQGRQELSSLFSGHFILQGRLTSKAPAIMADQISVISNTAETTRPSSQPSQQISLPKWPNQKHKKQTVSSLSRQQHG